MNFMDLANNYLNFYGGYFEQIDHARGYYRRFVNERYQTNYSGDLDAIRDFNERFQLVNIRNEASTLPQRFEEMANERLAFHDWLVKEGKIFDYEPLLLPSQRQIFGKLECVMPAIDMSPGSMEKSWRLHAARIVDFYVSGAAKDLGFYPQALPSPTYERFQVNLPLWYFLRGEKTSNPSDIVGGFSLNAEQRAVYTSILRHECIEGLNLHLGNVLRTKTEDDVEITISSEHGRSFLSDLANGKRVLWRREKDKQISPSASIFVGIPGTDGGVIFPSPVDVLLLAIRGAAEEYVYLRDHLIKSSSALSNSSSARQEIYTRTILDQLNSDFAIVRDNKQAHEQAFAILPERLDALRSQWTGYAQAYGQDREFSTWASQRGTRFARQFAEARKTVNCANLRAGDDAVYALEQIEAAIRTVAEAMTTYEKHKQRQQASTASANVASKGTAQQTTPRNHAKTDKETGDLGRMKDSNKPVIALAYQLAVEPLITTLNETPDQTTNDLKEALFNDVIVSTAANALDPSFKIRPGSAKKPIDAAQSALKVILGNTEHYQKVIARLCEQPLLLAVITEDAALLAQAAVYYNRHRGPLIEGRTAHGPNENVNLAGVGYLCRKLLERKFFPPVIEAPATEIAAPVAVAAEPQAPLATEASPVVEAPEALPSAGEITTIADMAAVESLPVIATEATAIVETPAPEPAVDPEVQAAQNRATWDAIKAGQAAALVRRSQRGPHQKRDATPGGYAQAIQRNAHHTGGLNTLEEAMRRAANPEEQEKKERRGKKGRNL